jgi:protein gp37
LLGPINLGDARPDWLITGGESGPHFRPLDMDAVRSLRDQCAHNGITFRHKQNGGFHGKASECLLDGIEYKGFPPALAA